MRGLKGLKVYEIHLRQRQRRDQSEKKKKKGEENHDEEVENAATRVLLISFEGSRG